MPIKGVTGKFKTRLASVLFAGGVFLLPVENVFADADLSTSSSSFISQDIPNRPDYMDSGGVWNGATDVTDTTGDTFRITLVNNAPGTNATEIQNNTAYGIAITADVATGFRLPSAPFVVTVSELSGGGNCLAIGAVNATQPGGIGTPINFNVPAADIPPGCQYQFDLGLTTSSVAPFVASGTYAVDFTASYSNFDGTPVNPTETETINVEVRSSNVAILKTAVTPIAGDGDSVTFNVAVIATGPGGIFDVNVTDVLGPDFDAGSLNMTAASGSFVSPVYNIPYLHPNGGALNITTTATVQVDPAAVSCPVLSNTVNVTEQTGGSDTSNDAVAFDLQEPLLVFTAPDITIPLNGGPTAVNVGVTNNGTGTAKNVSLTVPGAGTDLDNFNITVTSPGWSFDSATDVFTYAGTITAGATQTLSFTLEATACPPPAGGGLNWMLVYQNVCGTAFNPADQNSNLNIGNVPDATITKTSSTGALNVGQPASYTLALGGTNLAGLPANDGNNANNNDFTISDTFPVGIQNIAIPSIPAGTEVEVQGVGVFTGSVPLGQIPENGTIFWRGDVVDLQATPNLQVNFDGGGTGVCPTGQTITNNASLATNCAINDADGAGFILNENPAGGAVLNIGVAGGPFEAGAPDTNNINRDENREAEHIPFTVSYAFPPGYEAGAISWGDLQFSGELRTGEGAGSPLVLTDNRTQVLLTVTGAGSTCTQTALNPAVHFTGGDGVNPLMVNNFGFVPALCGVAATVDNVTLQLEYAATSAEGTLSGADPYNDDPVDEANIGTYIENTSLTIVGATPGCTGTTTFDQGVAVAIERSDLELTGSVNNGNDVSVCAIVPVNINLNELNADTSADNLLFNLGLTNLQIVDGADAPSVNVDNDITRNGGFADAGFTLNTPPNDNDGPVEYALLPTSANISGAGILSFNARVLDVGAAFNATLSFDSKHTSPDAGGDADRDYSFILNSAPANFRTADLNLEFFPPSLILRDQTNYSFRAHIVNTGDGDAEGGVFEITLPPEMNYVSSSSPSAGIVGVPSGQTIRWDLSQSALGAIGTGESIDIDINVAITQQSCFQSGIPAQDDIDSLTNWGCAAPLGHQELLPNTPDIVIPTAQVTLTHDVNNSYCELCNEGEVHLFVRNTGGILATDVEVTEDFLATGLQLVPGSVSCVSDEGACVVAVQPTQAGTQVDFTSTNIPLLANLYSAFSAAPNTPQEIEIIFRVRRPIGDEEALTSVVRNIEATGQYGLFCDQNSATPVRLNALPDNIVLPIQQPVPQVDKQGRNVDAGQTSSQYTDTVYGGRGDRVVWRINVRNLGDANLEDLLVQDIISPVTTVNFNFLAVCPAQVPDGEALARPFAMPTGCFAPDASQSTVRDVAGTFGANGPNGEDVNSNSNEFIYILGEILDQCTNMNNRADVSWGCDGEDGAPPYDTAGGIVLPASPIPAGFDLDDTELLSTDVIPAGVTVTAHTAQGIDGGADLGYRGRISFTISNGSGGTIKNLILRDTLPMGYAIDPTQFVLDGGSYYLPLTIATNFGNNYNGMVERVLWLNRDGANYENNTAPEFQLVSDPNVLPIEEAPDRINIIRHGDDITITFDIVRIADFDFQGAPDIATESSATCTDPRFPGGFSPIAIINPAADCPAPVAAGFPNQSNQLELGFSNSCDIALRDINGVANTATLNNISIDPEDLDIDVDPGTNRVYILSDPVAFLDLPVEVTNNGGHDASNHYILVTVGGGLSLPIGAPAGCTALIGAPAGRVP
ncbi:MAG: DUF11 domain-containing protein, partial [Gammaproteobacteria bacterium]|nr:DUF11 domain-containing protein [Gammaproteobacteria bacterium]